MSTTNTSTGTLGGVQSTFVTETITETIFTSTGWTYKAETVTSNDTNTPTTYTTGDYLLTTITQSGAISTYTTTYVSGHQTITIPNSGSAPTATPAPGSAAGGLGDFTLGEKVGMGIGAGLGALAIFALIWFMVRKRRRGAVRLPTSEPQPLMSEKQNPQSSTKNHNSTSDVRQIPSEVWT